MNSLERVKAALHFTRPDKPPIWKMGIADVLPLAMLPPKTWQPGHLPEEKGLFPHPIDDVVVRTGLYRWKKPEWAKIPKYRFNRWLKIPRDEIDEWGCIWHRSGGNKTMGHPGRASMPDWKDLDDYLEKYTPDATDKKRYVMSTLMSKLLPLKKYRMGVLGSMGPSQTASMIRGFNQYLVDHAKNPEEMKKLLAHLTEFYVTCIKMWVKTGAKPNGFLLVDDLGEQTGPFFSPRMFKIFYEPVYRTIIEAAHEYGCEMHLHCCGKVDRLLPLFIEWGLDAIEFDSPRMSGYADLKQFRGKIMFWGCANIQSIYVNGTPDEVRREIWHMIRNLGTPDGGFGLYPYPQYYHINVPDENRKALYEGLKLYGSYSKIPKHWWEYPTLEEWDMDTVPPLPPLTLT
ncbi:MAG: uroporphyrinogen decarboxylase family protein [Promethearchaeota archaeon]